MHTTIDMRQGPVSESGESEAEGGGDGEGDPDSEIPLAPGTNDLGELVYDTATRQWTYVNIP